jgi:hypothetical protein
MSNILNPIAKEKLLAELSPKLLLKQTIKGGNQIYSFTIKECQSLMYEVARLREVSYRAAGCGTGNIIDIDDYDINPPAYNQLIVWNPREKEIVGGYRYAVCSDFLDDINHLSMAHYFKFSKEFVKNYLPYSMELGRAWVNPEYQPSSGNRKSIFALDNLWDGIGAVLRKHQHVKYLYGKLTIPENYNNVARYLLQWILDHYFKDSQNLINPEDNVTTPNVLSVAGNTLSRNNFEKDFHIVAQYIRNIGYTVPPLVTAYTGLANKITTFGTTLNPELNNSFETGLMIDIKDVYPNKLDRYVYGNHLNNSVAA